MGHGNMRAMCIQVDGRDRHENGQCKIEKYPGVSCHEEPVRTPVKELLSYGEGVTPMVDDPSKQQQFCHAHTIADVLHEAMAGQGVDMMAPVEHEVEKPDVIQGEGNPGMAVALVACDLIHEKNAAPIDQHVPTADHGSIGLPLDGHIIDDMTSEIGENP